MVTHDANGDSINHDKLIQESPPTGVIRNVRQPLQFLMHFLDYEKVSTEVIYAN